MAPYRPNTTKEKQVSQKSRAAKRAQRKNVKRKAGLVLAHKSDDRERYFDRKYSAREVREIRRAQRRGEPLT